MEPTTTPTTTGAPQPLPEPVLIRYVGDGSGRIPGVPTRDLYQRDVDRMRPEALREAMASSLYEITSGARLPLNRSAVTEAPPETPPETPPPADSGTGTKKTAKGGEG